MDRLILDYGSSRDRSSEISVDAGEMVRRRDEPPFKRRCLL